ncbi:ABC transporter substrate-binding protein [Georgenia sp. Z1491]|uniref:ABC transporter substrate-binding protein n=1 Tax=Georgenia sp. Z1491 TaxID=3416707 RepID=UPI003CF0A286
MARTTRVRRSAAVPKALPAVAGAAMLLSACAAASGAGSGEAADIDGEPVNGGTLHYRAAPGPGGGSSIDPATATGYGLAVPLRQTVDSLVLHDADGDFEPWLATDWTVNDDATVYTFTLREDVTFSNGEELDAEAVAASYRSIVDAGASFAVANSWIGDLGEIVTPSEYEVEFRFESPNSSFLQAASTSALGIVAPETSARTFEERQEGLTVVGSGPFVATDVRANEGYVLERRDDYAWAPESFPNQGAAHLDAIEVHHISDNSIAASELRAGGLTLLHNTEPADKTELSTNPDVTIRTEPLPSGAIGLVANTEHPGLDEPEVREALSLAVDRDAILERASAIDVPASSVLSATNPYWEDLSDHIVTDVARAEDLLDEAGWLPAEDGVRERDGERLSFDLIYTGSTISHEPNLAVLQSQWAQIGVELTFGSLTTPDLNQRIASGDYAFSWQLAGRPDPEVLRTNFAGNDEELDALFGEILSTPGQEERRPLVTEAAELVLDRGYFIPLYDFVQPLAYRNELALPTFEASHMPLLVNAWIEE